MVSALNNDDVLTEILLRMPAKSLIRFKSVCKKWLSLISSYYFYRQHALRRAKPRPSLILQHSVTGLHPDFYHYNLTSMNSGENVLIPYTLTVFPHHYDYKILQACNGLLLLQAYNISYCRRSSYHVYNPTTRQSTEINNPNCNGDAAVALAFDPSKSPYYKIVYIKSRSSSNAGEIYQAEVYDSERRSWKLISKHSTSHRCFSGAHAQYWNNAIFWWYTYTDALFCFDIAKDEVKTLSTPQYHGEGDPYIQELDGNFYYLRLTFKPVLDEYGVSHVLLVAVWELGGDGNSEWLFKHNVMFISEGKGKCIGLMGEAENLVVLIYHQSSRKMKAYSFLHKRGEDVLGFTAPYHAYDEVYFTNHHLQAFQFRETLALV